MITPLLEKMLLAGSAKNKILWFGYGMYKQIQVPSDSFIVIHKIHWNGWLNPKFANAYKLTWKDFFRFNEYSLKVQSDKESPIYYQMRNEVNFEDFTCCTDTPPRPATGTACVRFNDGEFGPEFLFSFTFGTLGSFNATINTLNLAISLANVIAQLAIFQPTWTVSGTVDFTGTQCFTFTTETPGTIYNGTTIIIAPVGPPPPGLFLFPGILTGGTAGLIGKPIILNEPIDLAQYNSSILLTPKKPIIFDTFITAYDYLNFTISRNALMPNTINFGLVNNKAEEAGVPFGINGQLVVLELGLLGTGGTTDLINPPSHLCTPSVLQTNNVENYHQDLDPPSGPDTDNGSFLNNPLSGFPSLEKSEYVQNPLIGIEYCIIQKNEAGKLSSL